MAATTGQPGGQPGPRWLLLLRPKWLAWHAFALLATLGMLYLGDWQLHRAESGNELSWAYTFEWPLFAAFAVYFWIKSLRDELRQEPGAPAETDSAAAQIAGIPAGAVAPAARPGGQAASGVQRPRAAPARQQAASWDATSWDATSWDATGQHADAADGGPPVDLARATPADGEAYLARLKAEVQRHGRRRGWR